MEGELSDVRTVQEMSLIDTEVQTKNRSMINVPDVRLKIRARTSAYGSLIN